ncbi:hypothetical protein BS47DRAFT_1353951 [Hydnum rufescens UP504]|uniref:Uncharacterized protein n=1 Tax=Hydnum rufescens UP504 TaxID=1448309 RepID=A0A9P6AGM4_9AGAM|nr:hypothetical protein BS47DRAFT_1353951 [Hydnum rufescens UP504]
MNLTGSPSIIRHFAGMRDLLMTPLAARRVVQCLKLLPLRRNRSRLPEETGRNRSSCGISRIRVVNFVLMIRSSSVQTARPIDIAGETTNQSAAEILSMKVPEIGVTSQTKGRLPVPHRFLWSGSAWGKGKPKSRDRSPDHVDWKDQERASWNRDQRRA